MVENPFYINIGKSPDAALSAALIKPGNEARFVYSNQSGEFIVASASDLQATHSELTPQVHVFPTPTSEILVGQNLIEFGKRGFRQALVPLGGNHVRVYARDSDNNVYMAFGELTSTAQDTVRVHCELRKPLPMTKDDLGREILLSCCVMYELYK